MGRVSDVPSKIAGSEIFVLTSRQEGYPNALIEAMSLGLSCISTDCPCGGPRDLITDGVNGLLVPVGDVKAMTDAMVRVLENEDFANKLGNAATGVQKRFAPDVANAMWKEYFDKIVRQ